MILALAGTLVVPLMVDDQAVYVDTAAPARL